MENLTMNNVAMAALLNETLPALASPTVHGASSIIRVFILSILGIGLAVLIYFYCRHVLLLLVLLVALVALLVGVVEAIIWLLHLCGTILPIWLLDSWNSATAWVLHAWHSCEMPVLIILGISFTLFMLFYCVLQVMGFEEYGPARASYAAMWMSSIGNVVAGSPYSLLQAVAMGGVSVLKVLLSILVLVAFVVGASEIVVWLVHSGATHVPTWLVDSWDSATAGVLQAWDSDEMLGWWNTAVAWPDHMWESITDHHKWKIYN